MPGMPTPRWIWIAGVATGPLLGAAAGPVRVACLGDSITLGARLPDPQRTAYPAVLQRLLGPAYDVRNFGAAGAALLRSGDAPYVNTNAFHQALAFRPQIAFIVLGANDTCAGTRGNWSKHDQIQTDALALVAALRTAQPGCRVILCAPPDFRTDQRSLPAARIAELKTRRPRLDWIRVALRQAAAAAAAEFADLRYTTWGRRRVVDGVHPTPAAAESMARRLCEAIHNPPDPAFTLVPPPETHPVRDDFHGATAWRFTLNGVPCRIACPSVTAAGRPWVWRARFWGHQPQFDLAMLERGFHLAYCDVAGLYGAPSAVQRWNRFHAFITGLGLARKPVLEGMSRGGLIVFNWAAANPDKVAGIYADNAVMDIQSWPGGLGRGQGSHACWSECWKAYGFTSLEEAKKWRRNPLDNLAPLAAAEIPLLFLMGSADTVVPPAENGEIAVRRYRSLGGPVQVIRKPGQHHHPHSLRNPAPLVEFALKAAQRLPACFDSRPKP